VPTFNAGFPRVTGRAKALEIARLETQFGIGPHRLNVIDLKATMRAAGYAGEAVTL
jgi:hypothetical protein